MASRTAAAAPETSRRGSSTVAAATTCTELLTIPTWRGDAVESSAGRRRGVAGPSLDLRHRWISNAAAPRRDSAPLASARVGAPGTARTARGVTAPVAGSADSSASLPPRSLRAGLGRPRRPGPSSPRHLVLLGGAVHQELRDE